MNVCEFWEVKNVPRPKIGKGLKPNEYAGGAYVGSCPNHTYVYQNVVDVLLHNKHPNLTSDDALGSIRIIDAIKSSSETGEEIFLNVL